MAKTTQREDHLKALYALGEQSRPSAWVSTNAMAMHLAVKPPSVTSMLQVLAELGWAEYRPYRGARLTVAGKKLALSLVRKHRLWETFLVEHLGFGWEEVHDIAEQLEHVDSISLVERLDAFLGHPTVDPHGDPIPDANGKLPEQAALVRLSEFEGAVPCEVAAVRHGGDDVLAEMSARGIGVGTRLNEGSIENLPEAWLGMLMVKTVSHE